MKSVLRVEPTNVRSRFSLRALGFIALISTALHAFGAPVTTHPRLWITEGDLPRLRSWAVASNPIWAQGLSVLAAQAKAEMDAGIMPGDDSGSPASQDPGHGYQHFTEQYAELFAFLSLVDPDEAARSDYAQRARTLLMYVINIAAQGAADGQPFRHLDFSTSDRSRWYGEGFALTVDWIYPVLSAADKATIRTVFLRWSDEQIHAGTTTNNHPEPIGVVNDPVLISDRTLVRWAGNNYYGAHMRNLGLMSMCLDPGDDPGNTLRNYLGNATGAWLYVVDYLLRTDGAGGLPLEGFEYGNEAVGYIVQFLWALRTAGQDDPAVWGPQVVFQNNPYWNDVVPAYLHSLSPVPVQSEYLGEPVYLPAWYGDGERYWAPDYIWLFGPIGLLDKADGNTARLQNLLWIQANLAPGGADDLPLRAGYKDFFSRGILYFLLFDPAVASYTDPRPSQALNFYSPSLNRLLSRTDWTEDAAWFSYKLSWAQIDHQQGNGNQFEFYRRGEWLTKERTGYGWEWGIPYNHNTLGLENDPPEHNDPCEYLHTLWLMGAQWLFVHSGDPVLVAHSFSSSYVYALRDATNLYNSQEEGSTDILHASRSILWLKPDLIVVYDRASSKTAGRFKRFWLNFPATGTVAGNLVTMATASGQRLFVTSLLPAGATLLTEPSSQVLGCTGDPVGWIADEEPMNFRLKIEAPGGPAATRFLAILQGADAGTSATPASLIQSRAGTPYEGALAGSTAFLFPVDISTPFASLSYTVPSATSLHLVTGLIPSGMYSAQLVPSGNNVQVTVTPGGTLQADGGGVLMIGSAPTCTLACIALASPASGQAPLAVNFTATATATNCTGQPAFSWILGDGTRSVLQNPSHTYSTAGTYTWTLTATVDGQTCIKSGTVTVSPKPTCTLACTALASPASGQAPLAVNFTATATATNCTGQPAFSWILGDGTRSVLQNPSHTYSTAGTYTWTLTATVDGQTCTKSGTVTATSTPTAGWESRGIGGGGALFSPSISPSDPNLIYMATDMSAVFRTRDFGRSWETLPFQQIQGGVYSEVRFTSAPSVLYSLFLDDNDNRTPVKSTDGGATWAPLGSSPWDSLEYVILYADPHSTTRLLGADWDALFFSSDGGATFREVYRTPNGGRGMCFAGVFWDGNNIFAGTADGLVVSTDGGATFSLTAVTGLPAGESMASFAGAKKGSAYRFFAVLMSAGDYSHLDPPQSYGYFSGVYRLNWGDPSWTRALGPESGLLGFFAAMAEGETDVCYIAGGHTDGQVAVYKTADGGANWERVLQTAENANVATGWMGDGGDLGWGWAESAFGLAVSPGDPDRVIVTDWGFVHVTEDGGANWCQAYVDQSTQNPAGSPTPKSKAYRGIGAEDTSVWSLHWASASTLFASFTDIGGIRSADGGSAWSSALSSGLVYADHIHNTYQVIQHPSNGTLYAAVSSVHDLYQSRYLYDENDPGEGIDGIDDERGAILFSSNQGASWQMLHDFGHPVCWLAMDPNQPETMYASVVHSTAGGIFVTRNLSAGTSSTWTRLAVPARTHGHPFNIRVLADGTLVTTYSGWRDANGAFQEVSGLFASTDGGASWQDRSDPGMRMWTKDVIIDPHDASQQTWYVTVFSHWGHPPNELGGIYRTQDRGQTWTRISDLYRVNSITVHPDNPNRAYVSTEADGLWKTENLRDPSPAFARVEDYPFRQPMRIFFNPYSHDEVWVTSFGNGLRVSTTTGQCTLACTATVPAACTAGSPVGFASTATSSNCTGAVIFAWSFGDGATSSEQNPSHTYSVAGLYNWTLTASQDGESCIQSGTVNVSAGVPGDCDGDGQVSIGEVQKAINMFLGTIAPGCGVDCNGDRQISIGEVQKVINAFLGLTVTC